MDSHDVGTMRRAALRTRLVRVVLVVSAVALLAGAAASARSLDGETSDGLLGSSGVLVIDFSLSIGNDDYKVVRGTLRRLAAADGALGLVTFSDVPYEMLPPGSPSSALQPLLRLLEPRASGDQDPSLTRNPWSQSFSAGTRISAALELAGDMLVRDGIENGTILLLSDLITAPDDVPRLARTLQQLQDLSIDVRVVPLAALPDGLTIFEGILGKQSVIAPSSVASADPLPTGGSSELPLVLLVLGTLVLVAVAAHERFAGRLGLPAPEGGAA